MDTITNNERIRSRYLAKYIRNVQQANEGTAAQYEYRLSKFEKYVVTVSEEEQQERQQQSQELTPLDYVIDELKSGNNSRIDPYDLFLALLPTLKKRKA